MSIVSTDQNLDAALSLQLLQSRGVLNTPDYLGLMIGIWASLVLDLQLLFVILRYFKPYYG